jgi:membrane protein required for colicin V production
MNLVDVIVLILIVLSAILGFARGFVREVLGVGAWLGAALVAISCFHFIQPTMHRLISNENIADPVGFGALFLIALIVFSLLSRVTSNLVRGSMLSGLDRILGIFFGIARGAILLSIVYIVGGALVPSDHWSTEIRDSRSLPYIHRGATWIIQAVPEQMRPHLQPLPDTTTPAAPPAE